MGSVALQVVHADLYVSDRFTGWRERVLTNLSDLYSQQTKAFPPDVSQQMVARVNPLLPLMDLISLPKHLCRIRTLSVQATTS